ncbi:MAG: hypothetical protein NXI01_06915 [Gammaproteobacteria bacterium]|nr:hypothetical protein [Gammaproteobacteria bacterium]
MKNLWRQYKIWRWKLRLNLNGHLETLQHLSCNINGFELSRRARSESDAFEYVYGEIESMSFIALLSLTKPNATTVFYDLGSGTGKTVLACAMVFDIQKACGIELFSPLDQAAKQQAHALSTIEAYQDSAKKIDFICDDFLSADFSDATIIFISATGLFGATWTRLNERLAQLAHAPIIITTTKKLLSHHFKTLHKTRVQMTWGIVDTYIQQIDSTSSASYSSDSHIAL